MPRSTWLVPILKGNLFLVGGWGVRVPELPVPNPMRTAFWSRVWLSEHRMGVPKQG